MRAPSRELLQALRAAVDIVPKQSIVGGQSSASTALQHNRSLSQFKYPKSTSHGRIINILLPSRKRQSFFSTFCGSQDSQPSTAASSSSARTRTRNPYAPTHSDRGPKSKEDTQTDFGAMDVLGHIPAPATSIDACTADGFHLDNGIKTHSGHGLIVVGGEAFTWCPWTKPGAGSNPAKVGKISDLLDVRRGILDLPPASFGLLELLHPKPDLLIIGTGARLWMLSAGTRKHIAEVLGCRVDVMDTGNATAAYNLLAKERGIEGGAGVGGVFLPIGWKGPSAA